MDQQELRLRLIEAASKLPHSTHPAGPAAGVVETARLWEAHVAPSVGSVPPPGKLGLPKSLK